MDRITRRSAVALAAAGTVARGWQLAAEPAIVPRPLRLTMREGAFPVNGKTEVLAGKGTGAEASWLARLLNCPLAGATPEPGAVELRLNPKLASAGSEGYRLQVSADRVTLEAANPAGVYYAAQSLRQLLPIDAFGKAGRGKAEWRVPCVEIEDQPRFPWRGGHLDVVRHFMPKAAVLKYIDTLAAHKINTFHFHLTDDQGWRIEIRKYPKLTSVGGMRRESRVGHELKPKGFDGTPHGGFYTQADIREIVAYAAARHINVVPEIEMPGHAQAALAAYPEFGCTGAKVEVWTQWGVSKNVFNVNEKTIMFLQNVLSEVLELFPSPYVHVGGDEVPQDQWKASAEVQARMKELGLQTETQLHTWFIGRMNDYLRSRGRTLVGWDEIIEGGMTPGAVVMSWRGEKGGVEAASHGHNVVMTPGDFTYYNFYQSKDPKEPLAIGGFIDLAKAYNYEPVPSALDAKQSQRILGSQGQLWTEYIPTPDLLEYMAFPRMCAMAEVGWTAKERKNYADFAGRMKMHVQRLDAMGIRYHPLSSTS